MAEYSKLSSNALRCIIDSYELKFDKCSHISGGMANSSYLVNEDYVLTILDNHTLGSAMKLVEIVSELSLHGFPVIPYERLPSGASIATSGAGLTTLRRHAKGSTMKAENYKSSNNLLIEMARLHRFSPKVELSSFGRRLPATSKTILKDNSAPQDIVCAVDHMFDIQMKGFLKRQSLCFVHGDLSGENVIIGDDCSITIIDWETCCLDDPMLDLGIFIAHATKCGAIASKSDISDCVEIYKTEFPEQLISISMVLEAAKYSAVFLAFHRFNRHCVRYPSHENKFLYQEMLSIYDRLEEWSK